MKKILFSLFVIAAVAGCKKDNNHIFNKSPDERLNEALAGYQATLAGAPYGWNAVLYPKGGGAYAFYFKFNDANRVQMIADINTASATTVKESSYRLKALQQPSLLFDTYSYLHILADPDGSVNGGTDGQGLLSDFEFYFNDSTTADTIKLTGRVNGSKAVLVKATQEEAQAYTGGAFDVSVLSENLSPILQYFKRFTIGGDTYDINVNPSTRIIIFTWSDANGEVQTFTTAFYYTLEGVRFQNPFVLGSTSITGLSDFLWSGGTGTLNLTAGNTPATIKGAARPLVIDVNAPQRWWQTAVNDGAYWESFAGFHVNGVDDAFGIGTLSKFYSLIYAPEYEAGVDLYAPLFINAAGTGLEPHYGGAISTPEFTPDGRAVFPILGTYGPYPPTGPAAESLGQLLIPQGYYFIQTSASTYDMVSADNAKTWITWSY
ncbi:DUF4302 domain-containing protein [Agriterribacter sp.]|uniref:DUF4302 domain-containing protein n=1 Tax=Agriterribacter sp. TaxID=2821509 RepID=UPI002CC9CEC9|nr:DUF4302 domain-containing protein [Agriterribacter sp.]HTN07371.1 DUF4302 domain-containing protein [Agriterribacter sp.]